MRHSAQAFVSDRRGSTSLLFTTMMVPMLATVGAAVDIGTAVNAKFKLQSLVDKAAIAGARLPATSDENRARESEANLAANLETLEIEEIEKSVDASNADVRVEVTYQHPTAILKLLGIDAIPIKAHATARSQIENGGVACIVALNASRDDAFHLQGINEANSHNCWVWVNSTSPTSISATGAASATAQGFCTHGGISGPEHFGPRPYAGCNTMDDPFREKFARLPPPSDPCKATNLQLQNGSYQLQPGTYCGNVVFKPHAHVQLSPGVYVIKDGSLEVQAGASLSGSGVTLYFTGTGTRMIVRGGADLDLRAPTSGDYAGFVLADPMLDASNPVVTETVIQGGGRIRLEGTVYAPQWRINISGNSEMNQDSLCFAMIADHYYMEGNGKLNVVAACDQAGMPQVMPAIKVGPMLLE